MKRSLLFIASVGLLLSLVASATEVQITQLPAPSISLWKFLAALPASMEAQIFYGLMLSGTIGMAAHYFTRWAKGEIGGSLITYLFDSYARRTALAASILIGMSVTAISSNVFVTESGTFVGWLNVIWFGLSNGFASDSIANKGEPAKTGGPI